MSYSYEKEREDIFTESGQRMFLAIRDRSAHLLRTAGAARAQEMMAGQSGSSWQMLACIDRMVELGELTEVSPAECWGQNRVFVRAGT